MAAASTRHIEPLIPQPVGDPIVWQDGTPILWQSTDPLIWQSYLGPEFAFRREVPRNRVPRALLRRGHVTNVLPAQVFIDASVPWAESVQPRRLRGLVRRRRAAVEVPPVQAVVAPGIVISPPPRRVLRGLARRRVRPLDVVHGAGSPHIPTRPRPGVLRIPKPLRIRRFEVVPPQLNPPLPLQGEVQPRRVRGFLTRRARRAEVVPPQFNPPFPIAETVQPRRLRSLLGRRARRYEAPITQAAPTAPAYPFAQLEQARRVRGLRVKRNTTAFPLEQVSIPEEIRSRRPRFARKTTRRPSEVVVAQQAAPNPDFSWPTGREARTLRGVSRRRGRGVEVVQTQAAPITPTLVPTSVQPRRLRGLIGRRTRRTEHIAGQHVSIVAPTVRRTRGVGRRKAKVVEVVPVQQTAVDPSIMWSRDQQARRLRGYARTRGKRTDVVQPQLNPPISLEAKHQPRRTRGIPRFRGRSSTPVPAQTAAFEGEIRFSKVSRVKRLGRRQRRPGFDTLGQAAGPTSFVKTWDGLPRGSIKTFDGLPNASTKTVDGLP